MTVTYETKIKKKRGQQVLEASVDKVIGELKGRFDGIVSKGSDVLTDAES